MQGIGGVLVRIIVLFAGAAAAFGLAQAMPTWETGLLLACAVLVGVGFLVDRWWAVAVLPLAAAAYLLGAIAIDPSSATEGHDAPGWWYALVFWTLGTFGSVVFIGSGVLVRRTARDGRSSRPAASV